MGFGARVEYDWRMQAGFYTDSESNVAHLSQMQSNALTGIGFSSKATAYHTLQMDPER